MSADLSLPHLQSPPPPPAAAPSITFPCRLLRQQYQLVEQVEQAVKAADAAAEPGFHNAGGTFGTADDILKEGPIDLPGTNARRMASNPPPPSGHGRGP